MTVTFMSLPETRAGDRRGCRDRCGSWAPEGAATSTIESLGAADPLAQGEAVAAGDLDDEVAQAPGVVGQRHDHGGAVALAVVVHAVHVGHADVGRGRLVHAG